MAYSPLELSIKRAKGLAHTSSRKNVTNPFYEAAINHMANQLAYLEKLVGRPITDEEKDNLYEFYQSLHPRTRESFEEMFGPVFF